MEMSKKGRVREVMEARRIVSHAVLGAGNEVFQTEEAVKTLQQRLLTQ
jgi:hypothetical protein